jgi:predicted AAA+ superfamily ATPase
MEQIVRKLDPFRDFLPIAAQCSGKILNFSSISREIGISVPTVQTYFQILEETYIGFYLPHFHRSVRKSQIQSPKFYLFDNGVTKSLEGSLDSAPTPGTSGYGSLFEAFLVQEIFRLNQYFEKDYRLSFFATADSEIDLVLSRGRKTLLVEIKSANRIDETEVRRFVRASGAFCSATEKFYLSHDSHAAKIDGIQCLPWHEFLMKFSSLV